MDKEFRLSPSPTKKTTGRKNQTNARNKSAAAKKSAAVAAGKGSKARQSPMNGSTVEEVTLPSDEEETTGAGEQVSIILSKLGSELQQRMKAKRQRLEACFISVKDTPNTILNTLSTQAVERSKVIQSFQSKSNEMVSQVESVMELQKATEEKLNKLILSTQKHFDTIKDSLNSCLTGLLDTVKQFENVSSDDTKQLEGKHNENSQKQLDEIQKQLGLLQKKILLEGQNEETENIKSSFKLT